MIGKNYPLVMFFWNTCWWGYYPAVKFLKYSIDIHGRVPA
jgi:hypothetical protein